MKDKISNKTGFTGVHWHKTGRWMAAGNDQSGRKVAFYSKCFGKALMARKAHERAIGFHPNHGKIV